MLVRDDDSGATFSPDGKRLAFVRANNPEQGKFLVLTANADGTDEKIFATGPASFSFQNWSRGRRRRDRSLWWRLALAKPRSRSSSTTWHPRKSELLARFDDLPLNSVLWLPDGRGLLATHQRDIGLVASTPNWLYLLLQGNFTPSPRIRMTI